ncbi:MAG: aldehyde dehydrogenase family protein, partial [Gammaproteobacteria bacterium]|nr:aldehyde dehydrogenase family protein [Gammaproteobacteria bacterium]
MTIKTINPATGEVIQSYPEMTVDQVDQILQKVKNAQSIWRDFSFSARAEKMHTVAKTLEKNKEKYAQLISMEMGKTIVSARAEIEKCQWVCNYYADEAEHYLAPRFIKTDYKKSYVAYKPLGSVMAIMPWNFPFWQVFRFAAPNLMAGNGCVLQHASIVTGCALMIEEIFKEALLPENIFRTVIVNHPISKYIMQHDLISAVTFTGSDRAGRIVGAQAASALKKVVLELGGSDPYLILADADLETAAESIVKSRMNNSGQVCIAAKRIIAEKTIFDKLLNIILEKLKNYPMGDPLNESTKLGPLARADLRETVHRQVLASIEQGAELLSGGFIPEGKGFYYPSTVLNYVKPGMPAFDEELFGPVISMIVVKDEEEGIA